MKNLYQEKINGRSGALALWRSGALALWRSGALALWRSGALALCIIGIGLLVSCSAETGSNADESPKTSITALTYSNTPIGAYTDIAITDAIPTLTPTGASATYTIDPALPEGLTLDSDGTISGTPTLVQTAIDYVVTATGTGDYSGTQTTMIRIVIYDSTLPTLTGAFSYVDITRDFGDATNTYSPTVAPAFSDGAEITYSIDPAIDNTAVDGTGISFDTTNGKLTVNLSANAQTQSYTVTVSAFTTHKGSVTAGVNLVINALPITALTYSNTPIIVPPGSAITDAIPTLTPTEANATYTIDPALPTGLSLASDGKISGTPTLEQIATDYVVTAAGTGNYSGTQTATINITVQTVSATDVPRSKATGTGTVPVVSTFEYDKHRVHHVIFSLTAPATADYTVVAKESTANAPTADEITAATAKMVVTAGTTAVNVYLAYPIGADLTTNNFDVLLKADTMYAIYAMDGASTVTKLVDISTDPVPETLNADEFYGTPPSDLTFATKKTNPMVFYQRGQQAVRNTLVFTSSYPGVLLSLCIFNFQCTPSISDPFSFSVLDNDTVNGPIQITIVNPVGGDYTGTNTTFTITFRSSDRGDGVVVYNYTSGTFNW